NNKYCEHCKRKGHKEDECKKKKGIKCNHCGRLGHEENQCWHKKKVETESKKQQQEEQPKKSSSLKASREEGTLQHAIIITGGVKTEAMVDSCATDGAFVDEQLASQMMWHAEPSATGSHINGIGNGGYARWGKAEIEVGGRKEIFNVAVTSDLHGTAK